MEIVVRLCTFRNLVRLVWLNPLRDLALAEQMLVSGHIKLGARRKELESEGGTLGAGMIGKAKCANQLIDFHLSRAEFEHISINSGRSYKMASRENNKQRPSDSPRSPNPSAKQ